VAAVAVEIAAVVAAAGLAARTERREGPDTRRVSGHYDPIVQKYVMSELDSGLRVITERLSSVRSVALGFWIGAGSRDETPARSGISHFIEHMLFKGTQSYSAQEIAETFDALGGELNAATSREHTVVYVRVADHHLERALDVMSDMVYAPLFADIDSEREVVLEEIAMYEDTPHELVHDLFSQAVFGDHPLGRPILGGADVISTVGRRTLATYHRRMYSPGNIVFAAAGNVRHEELLELLERAEAKQDGAAGSGPRVRSPLVKAPPPTVLFQRKKTEQYHVCLGAPGIARSDRRRFAASLLDGLLGGSASSRLFQEIREKRGLAYAVYTFGTQYTDTGLMGFYVGTREENLAECLEIAMSEIADVAAGNVSDSELERAKENLKGRILLSMEATSNRMSRLGKSLITDTELLMLDRIVAEIDAVTSDAVAELAGMLLAPERLSAAGIGPSEGRFREAVRRIDPSLAARAAAA
jgi:predicted Zn-dependent peptidase